MIKIIKNDTVKVIAGNNKGKIGKVLKVYPKTNRIIVEKVHLVKRHTETALAAGSGRHHRKRSPHPCL